MARPEIEPHLRRRLTDERTVIGSLFQVDKGKDFFCSLYAPGESAAAVLDHGSVYATGYGASPDDAVWAAHREMWKGM